MQYTGKQLIKKYLRAGWEIHKYTCTRAILVFRRDEGSLYETIPHRKSIKNEMMQQLLKRLEEGQ
jgi:hypothetical protein